MTRRVYLDHNASTPVHPEVVAEMLPYFSDVYGNPSSVHGFGRDARGAVDAARDRVAAFLRVRPDELVFTSGGTESDNFGVKGLALARGRGHVITSKVEHHAVLRSAQSLEAQGFAVSYLPVDQYGMVDPDDVRRALRPDTIAISIMHANSEVGTIQPVRAIGALAREAGVPFHVDAVQTFGKVEIDVDAMNIDALSFSGHKIYGPKGIAGLYIRRGTKMVSIQHGGEHERRRRAGTENVPGIVGLGKAVEVRARDMKTEAEDLKGIAVSAGSACTAGSVEPSHVLVAMGVPLDWAMGAVRSSLGRSTTAEDVDYVVASVTEAARRIRQAMPVGAA